MAKHTQFSASGCVPSRNLVRSRSVLGQAQTPRRRSLPFAAIALVVLAAPALGLAGSSQSASSLRAQNAQLESRSRSAVLELYSLDQRLAGTQARYAQLEGDATSLQAQRADLTRALIDRPARQPHRPASARGPAAADVRAGRRRAARDHLRFEEPRRGALEPRQPEPDDRPERGRPPADRTQPTRRCRAASGRLAARQAAIAEALAAARATAESLLQTRADRQAYSPRSPAKRRLNDAPDLLAPGPGAAPPSCAATRSPVP